ncbi:MAG: hypothetical protein NWF11_00705 [Candidatus Bathyarchaeota archaeon]|nr:hypothetical protein [Candidatus Bathyarchaeota archaeon]
MIPASYNSLEASTEKIIDQDGEEGTKEKNQNQRTLHASEAALDQKGKERHYTRQMETFQKDQVKIIK